MSNDLASPIAVQSAKVSTSGSMIIQGYHRTKDLNSPESIAYRGYNASKAKKTNGSMYGAGFYMTRNMVDHLHSRYDGNYGTVIIKNEVNMKDVLICDLALSVKVFGKPVNIWQQFINKKVMLPAAKARDLQDYSQGCEKAYSDNDGITANIVKNMIDYNLIDPKIWAGLAYTGQQDGACLVMYNTEQVFPRAWALYDANKFKRQFEKDNDIENGLVTDDEDEDEDVDDDTNDSNEYKHYAIRSLVWQNLNKKEVDKIRAGFPPRFARWLEMFARGKKDQAQARFNECARKLTADHQNTFINDIAHYSEMSTTAFNFVQSLLNNMPNDCVEALIKTCTSHVFNNVTLNEKGAIFCKKSQCQFFGIAKHKVFNSVIAKWYAVYIDLFNQHYTSLAKQSTNYVLSVSQTDAFLDTVYYITKAVANYSAVNYQVDIVNSLRYQEFCGKRVELNVTSTIREKINKLEIGREAIANYMLDLMRIPQVMQNNQALTMVLEVWSAHRETVSTYKPSKNKVVVTELADIEPNIAELLENNFGMVEDLQASYQQKLKPENSRTKAKAKSVVEDEDDSDEDDDD